MTEPNPALQAADAAAAQTFARMQKLSPMTTESLSGPLREVVLAAMAICFMDGSLYGAKRLAEGLSKS